MVRPSPSLYLFPVSSIIKNMSISPKHNQRIKNLRQRGRSIPEISRALHIPPSTVLRHTKGVKILPQYIQRWQNRRNTSKILSERNWNIARQRAKCRIDSISDKELALIGACLYWAEGTKRDLSLSNTDPLLIRIFLSVLRRIFNIQDGDIKISVRIYEDLNKRACLQFWSKTTGISLGKHTSVNVLRGRKKGKLKYGMCRIRVRKGGLLHKELSAIIEQINHLISPHSSMDRTIRS